MYANQFGCDGGRLYFDGSPLVVVNGNCVAQGEQFGIHDVQVQLLPRSFSLYVFTLFTLFVRFSRQA
jgi:hypothetical protein